MRALGILLALALAGCGGGGGGDASSPSPTPDNGAENGWLSFAWSQNNYTVVNGGSATLSLTATSSRTIAEQLNARVEVTPDFDGRVAVTAISDLQYRATLQTSPKAALGKHSGQLTVYLCKDAPEVCAQPYPGSPWKVPYQFEVITAPASKPLTQLPGASAWPNANGDLGGNKYLSTTADLKPGNFTLRWSKSFAPAVPAFVTAQGKLFTGGDKLAAYNEHDGSSAWTSTVGGYRPALANDKVLINSNGSLLTVDPATGSLQQTMTGVAAGNLVTDGTVAYAGTGQRLNLSTNSPIWTSDHTEVVNFFTPGFSKNYIYTLSITSETVKAYSTTTGNLVASIPVTWRSSGAARPFNLTAVGDDQVILSHYNFGWSALSAFSVQGNKKLWSVSAGFRSAPVIADSTAYVVNAPGNDFGPASLEARSTATGELLWSTQLPEGTLSPSDGIVYNITVVGNWVFVSSNRTSGGSTYAVSRQNHLQAWSYPIAGDLSASSNGLLYIATPAGQLTAINLQ